MAQQVNPRSRECRLRWGCGRNYVYYIQSKQFVRQELEGKGREASSMLGSVYLRALAALAETQSSVPSSNVREHTSACNSNSRDLQAPEHTYVYVHRHTCIHVKKIR